MAMRNIKPQVDMEIDLMKRDWRSWLDRVRRAASEVIPDSTTRYIVDKNDVITFIIEVGYKPGDEILLESLIDELLRRSNLPFYSPFKIVLRYPTSNGYNTIDVLNAFNGGRL